MFGARRRSTLAQPLVSTCCLRISDPYVCSELDQTCFNRLILMFVVAKSPNIFHLDRPSINALGSRNGIGEKGETVSSADFQCSCLIWFRRTWPHTSWAEISHRSWCLLAKLAKPMRTS